MCFALGCCFHVYNLEIDHLQQVLQESGQWTTLEDLLNGCVLSASACSSVNAFAACQSQCMHARRLTWPLSNTLNDQGNDEMRVYLMTGWLRSASSATVMSVCTHSGVIAPAMVHRWCIKAACDQGCMCPCCIAQHAKEPA